MNAKQKAALFADLKAAGRMDERELYVFNNAKLLPGGGFGMCIVSIAGQSLYITDTDMSGAVGPLIAAVPFAQMEQRKSSTFPFNPYLKFVWQGTPIHLGGVSKPMLEAIEKG